MLGGFGYGTTEQKRPSQATFKAQLKQTNIQKPTKQTSLLINPTVLTKENEKAGFPPYYVGCVAEPPLWIRSCQNTPVIEDFSGVRVKQPDMVMPSSHKNTLDCGIRNVLQELTSKQIIERLLLWQLLGSLAVAHCVRAGNSRYGGTGKQLPQRANADSKWKCWLHLPSAWGWWMGSLTWMARVKREPTAPRGVELEGPCQETHEGCNIKLAVLHLPKGALLTTILGKLQISFGNIFPAIITCSCVFSPSVKYILPP